MEALKKNQIVSITNRDTQGNDIDEGKAKLKKLQIADTHSEYWTVVFESDGFTTDRWIPVDYNPTNEDKRTRSEKGW